MAIRQQDIFALNNYSWTRAFMIGQLIADELKIERGFFFDDQWEREYAERMKALSVDPVRSGVESHLRCFVAQGCLLECLSWICFQRVEEMEGVLLGAKIEEIQGKSANLLDSSFMEMAENRRHLRRLKTKDPLRMSREDVKLWFARQDHKLFRAGFSRYEIRALRGEQEDDLRSKAEIAHLGTVLDRRAKRNARALPSDEFLSPKIRKLTESMLQLREHGKLNVLPQTRP